MSIDQIPTGGGGGNDPRLHVSDDQPDSSIVTEGDLWSKTVSNELFRATDSSTFVSVETTGSGSMTTVKEGGVQVGGADIEILDFGDGFDLVETPDKEINIALDVTEVDAAPVDIGTSNAIGAGSSFVNAGHVHNHPSGLGATLHHTKYTDAEAITAIEGEATLDLAGDVTIDGAKSLKVDVIDEKDAAAGVTIDGVLIKDSGIPEAVVTAHEAAIDHDALTNFASLEHVPVTDATSDPLVDGDAAADGTELTVARKDHIHPKHHSNEAAIEFIIDGGGSVITTGIKGDLEIPFACTIKAVRLFGDQSGAIVVDIWKDTFANFPPTNADSITASAVPTITASGVKSEDATLTGWTTAITKGDTLRFNVDSVTSIERLTLSLSIDKT